MGGRRRERELERERMIFDFVWSVSFDKAVLFFFFPIFLFLCLFDWIHLLPGFQ